MTNFDSFEGSVTSVGARRDAEPPDVVVESVGTDETPTTVAEEPIEDRLLRAYMNGYTDGILRGSRGRWDHS